MFSVRALCEEMTSEIFQEKEDKPDEALTDQEEEVFSGDAKSGVTSWAT
jgi:hypothetical protein